MGDQKKAELALAKYFSIDGLHYSNSTFLFASTPGETLTGGGADEVFFANNDGPTSTLSTMNGGGGSDIFVAGSGREHINGGPGFDTVVYMNSTAGVTVDLGSNTGQRGYAEGDQYTSIEGVIGSDYKDVLLGNSGVNILDGHGGDDILYGMGGADWLLGGRGDDTIYGFNNNSDGAATPHTSDRSEIYGGQGNDTIYASAQAEDINGGDVFGNAPYGSHPVDPGFNNQLPGFDHATYALSSSAVSIDMTTNVNHGGAAEGDKLTNIEWITGSKYGDGIVGSPGDDWIEGGAGDDVLTGAGGHNVFFYNLTSPITANATGASNAVDIGHDTIVDFHNGPTPAQFVDLISWFGEPTSAAHFTQSGANTVVTFDHVAGDVTVLNTVASSFAVFP